MMRCLSELGDLDNVDINSNIDRIKNNDGNNTVLVPFVNELWTLYSKLDSE